MKVHAQIFVCFNEIGRLCCLNNSDLTLRIRRDRFRISLEICKFYVE